MKNENFKLIINGLIIIFGTCALIYVLNIITPDRLKLDPAIWGTVSDWLIIILTLLTAIFIYKTLKSQYEVQKMQLEITNIELHKFRDLLRPEINVSFQEFDSITNRINFKISVLNRSLKNPRFISQSPLIINHAAKTESQLNNNYQYIIHDYMLPEDKRSIEIGIDFNDGTWYTKNDEKFEGFYFANILMHYEDTKNYLYENLIIIIVKPSENYLKVSLGDADYK